MTLLNWLVNWLWHQNNLSVEQQDKMNKLIHDFRLMESRACYLGCERGGWPRLKGEQKTNWFMRMFTW